MQENKGSSIGHFAVWAGLWSINILIVIFGSPFLIYKKLRAAFAKSGKNSQPDGEAKKNPTRYFPCKS